MSMPGKAQTLASELVWRHFAAMNMLAIIRLTDRQEQFCQHIVLGKSQAESYRLAYNASQKASEAHGARLVASGKIKARIAEIRAENAAASHVSVPILTKQLYAVARDAVQDRNQAAATQALMGIAKLHGLLIERHMVDAVIRKPSSSTAGPDELDEAQWLQEFGVEVKHSIDLQPDSKTEIPENDNT